MLQAGLKYSDTLQHIYLMQFHMDLGLVIKNIQWKVNKG
jgi:hypothetical protein